MLVEGVDTHLMVGWIRLRGTIRDTKSETAPNHLSFRKSRRQRPIFRFIYTHNFRINLPSHPHERAPYFTDSPLVRPTLDKSTDSDTESETDPNHPSFRKSRRQRPIFRLIYAHNTRIDLPFHPHESSPYFTDSTLVRPTLDKSTDSDTESETDPNHPNFRNSRRYLTGTSRPPRGKP